MSFEISFFIINLAAYASIALISYGKLLSCFELHSSLVRVFKQEIFAHKETGRKFS